MGDAGGPDGLERSDAVVPVTVGTVLWAIALVASLAFRSRLKADGTDWWIWVCATGVVLGLLGSWWVRRRRAAYRRRS
jgi:uncharacterized membrane protein YfcA